MAHCDPKMSDLVQMPSPTGRVRSRWHTPVNGAGNGLGCASNGNVAVCSLGGFGSSGPYLYALDANGTVLWHSDSVLNDTAFTSVPMVGANGEVIAADDEKLVRFSPSGEIVWQSPWGSSVGNPISPSQTQSGHIVVATSGGVVSAHDPRTGTRFGSLKLSASVGGFDGTFVTQNTPAIRGDRLYVVTAFQRDDDVADATHTGRLYAIDVDPAAPAPLSVAWYVEIGSRSGASPLAIGDVIYFDGDRPGPNVQAKDPHFFAVRDAGTHGELVWKKPISDSAVASAAQDPRGGLWVYANGSTKLLRLAEADGAVLQSVDVDQLVNAPGVHQPASAVSVQQGPSGHPYLVFSARPSLGQVYVVAVDAVTQTLAWRVPVGMSNLVNLSGGQFPVVRDANGAPVVVFVTKADGVNGVMGVAR